MVNLLFIGDVVGSIGCKAVRYMLPKLKIRYGGFDVVVANAENSAKGNGVSAESSDYLFESGCNVLTGGNHSFRNFSILKVLNKNGNILRPLNISKHSPGRGFVCLNVGSSSVVVVNLIGQVYLDASSSPFEEIDRLLSRVGAKLVFIDFHAEATGEKSALANFLDGRVSAVVGTHTHVQTNDARILKNGTGFLTDVGMVGPYDSVLGVMPECIIRRIVTKMPTRFEVSDVGSCVFNAVFLQLDENTSRCVKIEPICEILDL